MTTLVETSNGALAYDVLGSDDGPPVILLPSGGHNRHDYDELRALVQGQLRTIALDWPGHGESPPGRGVLSAMRMAAVAEEAIAQLAPEGAIVLGNSVGGFAAASLAIRRPELVRGLILVDSGGFARRSPLVLGFCALMGRRRFLRAIYPAFAARYMSARTADDRRARDGAIATTRGEPGLSAVSQLWRSFASREHDLRRSARAITAPTLIIWGRRDPVIPVRIGRAIERLIEGSRLVVLDTGHLPYTSEPELFAGELSAFAESIGAAEPAVRAA
jgi:pimeloyl-ACP methyl ester carboxylesterase